MMRSYFDPFIFEPQCGHVEEGFLNKCLQPEQIYSSEQKRCVFSIQWFVFIIFLQIIINRVF